MSSSQQVIEDFWNALSLVAKEVLTQGAQYGYGYSMVEIKFEDGLPSVIINSHTESRLYRNHDDAMNTIMRIINNTKKKGSQSFTVVRENNGEIKRVLLDEYSMQILKDGS